MKSAAKHVKHVINVKLLYYFNAITKYQPKSFTHGKKKDLLKK